MKKLSLFLVLTMLISIFAAMPVVQADETAFPDYSSWDYTAYDTVTVDGTSYTSWAIQRPYQDLVIEFDITLTEVSGKTPKMWYRLRKGTPNYAGEMYVTNSGFAIVTDWNSTDSYIWGNLSSSVGIFDTYATKKMRISSIGATYIVEQNVNEVWTRIGEFTDPNYDASTAGTQLQIATGNNNPFKLENIKIYKYEEPVTITPFVDYSAWELKEEVASASGSVDASTKWVSSGSYDDFVMEYTISATGNSGFGVWYNFRMNSTSPSRMFAQANSLVTEKTWGGYNYETMSTEYGILGTTGAEHKMRISVIGSVYTVEEYINNAWVRVGEYTDDGTSAAGPINFGGHQAGTTFTLKDIKIYQYVEPVVVTPFVDYSALTAKETLPSLSCAADHANSTYIKYLSTNNYENFVMEYTVSITEGSDDGYGLWLNFRKNSSAALSYITYAAQFDVNQAISSTYDYLNISKEYGILGAAGTEHIMRVSAIGRKYTFEEKINDEWVRVGEYTDDVDSASGQIEFSGYAPSGKTTLFTLSDIAIYELQNLTLTPGAISSAAAGTQIVFTADRAVATIPETLTITDGVNSFNASAAAGSSDTEVVVTLTDALDWSTEYTIDLSGVMDAYGICAKYVSFTTPDEPNGYVVGDAVFYKADGTTVIYAVEAGTLKVKRNVTRTIDTAATKVTLVTALYKTVGDITYMIDADVTESDTLVLNTASDLWGEITVPSDGAAYSIRTFVWQDMINCNPVAIPSDM